MLEYKGIMGGGKVLIDGDNLQIKQMIGGEDCTFSDIILVEYNEHNAYRFSVDIHTEKTIQAGAPHCIIFKEPVKATELYALLCEKQAQLAELAAEEANTEMEAALAELAEIDPKAADELRAELAAIDSFASDEVAHIPEGVFIPSRQVDFSAVGGLLALLQSGRISVDDSSKRFSVLGATATGAEQIFAYSDLLDFEINEDGSSIVKGRGMATAVGAATFGLAGAMIGSSGKRKNVDLCTSLEVRIFLNSLETSQIAIPLVAGKVKKGSFEYKNAMEKAQEIMSILTYIANQKDVHTEKNSTAANQNGTNISDADELLKFKGLLDSGIITQEEFDAKKKQILGL